MSGPRTSLFLKRTTAALATLTAFIVAVLAFSDHLKPITNGIYCVFADCKPPAPLGPSIKVLRAPDLVGLDGGRHKSGTMSNIDVSITDNPPGQPDTFVARWVWSGSGGTQHGSQNVIIDMKTKDGATVYSYPTGIDRSHCYYAPGNPETRPGTISGEASLIDHIDVRITEVTGNQGGC